MVYFIETLADLKINMYDWICDEILKYFMYFFVSTFFINVLRIFLNLGHTMYYGPI